MYNLNISQAEKHSLVNNLLLTKDYEHIFIGPEFVKNFYLRLCPKSKFITLPDKYFLSIRDYNRLMLSPWFYLLFKRFSHILICQLDVCIMTEIKLNKLTKYDYVGAPCTFNAGETQFVGNGGFSLRNVTSFTEALSKGFNAVEISLRKCNTFRNFLHYFLNKVGLYQFYIALGYINEDFIVSSYLKKPLKKAPLATAIRFCQDAVIDEAIIPSAYHGWEKNLTGDLKNKCWIQIKN